KNNNSRPFKGVKANNEINSRAISSLQQASTENALLLQKQTILQEELRTLRIEFSEKRKSVAGIRPSVRSDDKKVDELKRELFALQSSTAYQFSRLCMLAVRKPGKNTLMFPFRALRLVVAALVGRR